MNRKYSAAFPPVSAGAVGMNAGILAIAAVALLHLFMPGMDGRADGDFWWHIQYGKWFLEHGQIAAVDWLSWTKEGEQYTVTQWLGQVLIGVSFEVGGPRATAALTLAVVVGVVLCSYRICRIELGNGVLAAGLALALTTPYWSTYARPQMFGFACMAALIVLAERADRKEAGWGWKDAATVAVLMCAWTNLHGSFVMGIVYLAMKVAANSAKWVFEKPRQRAGWWDTNAWVLGAIAAGFAGSLINPYGPGSWAYAADVAGLMTTQVGVIAEWTPTALSTAAGSTFILLFVAVMISWAFADRKPRVDDVVMFVGMIMLGMMAVRQTSFATLAFVPIAARAISSYDLTAQLANKIPERVNSWVAAVVLAAFAVAGQAQTTWREGGLGEWQRHVFPVDASKFLTDNKIEGRLFNEATAGGWMSFHTGMKVFIDGRLDLHRDQEYFDWFFTRQGAPGWGKRLDENKADVFVIQSQSPLVSLLMQSRRAALVYADTRYAVLLERSAKHQEVIAKHEIDKVPFQIFDEKGRLKATLCGW
jgi:hypothetical protein